ncbi:MAG: hypothetical protein AAF681_14725, partial [Pseudomonadota bacterium]
IATYPAEPDVTETTDRNWVSGKRVEATTLVAESGGSGLVPAIEVEWYNLERKSIETTRVDGFELSVDAPVARDGPDVNPGLLLVLAVVVVVVFVAARVFRWILPRLRARYDIRQKEREGTEHWAYTQLQQAMRRRDYGGVISAYSTWQARLPTPDASEGPALQVALANVGRCFFGPAEETHASAWFELSKVLENYRAQHVTGRKRHNSGYRLAPINPERPR